MNYIVFDLEWNQCPYGKEFENPRLPFEIIEIGAVKLNEAKEYLDTFHTLVRPAVYRKLHFQTRKVITVTEKDLAKGIPFREAAAAFFKWCGDDFRFCTWGTSDLPELQRNLLYYHMGDLLPGPVLYEDVQKLFAIMRGERKVRRALKNAVELLELPEEGEFHLAREDAVYTARIFQRIPDEIIGDYFSIDCYQNPKSKKQEIRIRYKDYEKYISREFETKERLMSDSGVTAVRCFVCGKNVRRVIRYFSDARGRNHIAVGKCPEHGYVKSKIRVREAADGNYYAIRTTRQITEKELQEIRGKAEAGRRRRAKNRDSQMRE